MVCAKSETGIGGTLLAGFSHRAIYRHFFFLLAFLPIASGISLAENASDPNDASGCAACGGCGLFGGLLILIPISVLVLNIALLVWVARDAKARGMDSAVLWMVLVMLTSVVGLIIYILSRPQGNLIRCQSCNNERLQASAKCPHCGNA